MPILSRIIDNLLRDSATRRPVAVGDLPLEADLFHSLYPFLWEIVRCHRSLLVFINAAPFSQHGFDAPCGNFAVPTLLFGCRQLATALLECIGDVLPSEASLLQSMYPFL